jgi:hypothetical protein
MRWWGRLELSICGKEVNFSDEHPQVQLRTIRMEVSPDSEKRLYELCEAVNREVT